jgi:aspartate aminotransferase-like enzyme
MPVPLVLALKRAFDDLSNRGTHQNIAQKNSAQNGIENRVPQKMPLNRFIADLPR